MMVAIGIGIVVASIVALVIVPRVMFRRRK